MTETTMSTIKEAQPIVLIIPPEKYLFLLKTIKGFSDNIYKWGFEKFFSKKLLTELRIIRSILETNKVAPSKPTILTEEKTP